MLTSQQFARLTAKFTVGDDCWEWNACKTYNGYGQIRVAQKNWVAHRLTYTLLVGPIPEGLQLDHLCRNRACVNPKHLEPVTNKVNHERGAYAQKTHCPQGHGYTPGNTYVCKRGSRSCMICKRAAKQRFDARKRQSN